MRALARSEIDLPLSLATPCSVTTLSTVFLIVVTIDPGVSVARMRDTVPPAAVAGSTTKALPLSEYMAPRAKSAWPPLEDQYLRSEEHTSELQSLMRRSYAVFCLQKKKTQTKCDNSRR